MGLFDDFRRLTRRFSRNHRREDQPRQQPPFGFMGVAGEESIGSMSGPDLLAWENRGIPNIDRASDHTETQADERQDLATSLNFPLHWTSARLSWDYLFDFSVARELLAPRPDDLVLDSRPAAAERRSFSAAWPSARSRWTYRSK